MYYITFAFLPLKFWKSILWAVIIALGLFTPGEKLPDRRLLQIENADKIMHMLIFGFLQFLILLDIQLSGQLITRKRILYAILICAGYGMVTEIIQYLFISERKGSILDFLADTIGIMLSLGFFFLVQKFIIRWSRRRI